MAKLERFGSLGHFTNQSTLLYFDHGFGELERQLTQAADSLPFLVEL
jgi:hypothetical protein